MKLNHKYLRWFRRFKRASKEAEGCPGVYILEPDEFDRVMLDLQSPAEPTESIKRGAELLRKLYGHQQFSRDAT